MRDGSDTRKNADQPGNPTGMQAAMSGVLSSEGKWVIEVDRAVTFGWSRSSSR
jgi:hypothetical protein